MRLREAFSSVVSSWLLFCKRGQTSKARISSTLSEFMRPSNKTDADGLAVAVVLTLELVKIALVLVRRNRVARLIVNANHSLM
jgi:hypothetical protein